MVLLGGAFLCVFVRFVWLGVVWRGRYEEKPDVLSYFALHKLATYHSFHTFPNSHSQSLYFIYFLYFPCLLYFLYFTLDSLFSLFSLDPLPSSTTTSFKSLRGVSPCFTRTYEDFLKPFKIYLRSI